MSLDIGSKIKALRQKNKLSQNGLCGDFINRSILSKIENNKMEPSLSQLKYIADRLGVPPGYFLNNISYTECTQNTSIGNGSYVSLLFRDQNYHEVVKFYEYNPADFKSIEGICKYYYLGMSYFNQKIYKESVKPLKKYVNEYIKMSEEYQRQNIAAFAASLNALGKINLRSCCYDKAEYYLNTALRYISLYNETSSLISFTIHSNLALIYNHTAKYEKTIALTEKLLNSQQNLIYKLVVPELHRAANTAYYNLGDYDKALAHIKKSILLFCYEGNRYEIVHSNIDYINTLRCSGQFGAAFQVVEYCKREYCDNKDFYYKFLLQEMILNFNMKKYDKVLEIAQRLNLKELTSMSKCNYSFMLGHISFLKGSYGDACKHLIKCEKYFAERLYNTDLALLYEDLHIITTDVTYAEKSLKKRTEPCKKNILTRLYMY